MAGLSADLPTFNLYVPRTKRSDWSGPKATCTMVLKMWCGQTKSLFNWRPIAVFAVVRMGRSLVSNLDQNTQSKFMFGPGKAALNYAFLRGS